LGAGIPFWTIFFGTHDYNTKHSTSIILWQPGPTDSGLTPGEVGSSESCDGDSEGVRVLSRSDARPDESVTAAAAAPIRASRSAARRSIEEEAVVCEDVEGGRGGLC
jgi:hypothetical protein